MPVRRNSNRKSTLRTGRLLLAAAGMVAASQRVFATSYSYIGPNNGNFTTNTNWSPTGVPTNGDDVSLGNMNPKNLLGNVTVIVNTDLIPIGNGINSLTINSSALPAYMILHDTTANGLMFAITENIGTTISDNEFLQDGGSVNDLSPNLSTQSTLDLGVNASSTNNTYSLSGTNTSLADEGNANIGVAGAGSFIQTGGTASFDENGLYGQLTLGVDATGNGIYNLSGGTLIADATFVGSAGTGSFNLSGSAVFECDAITISSVSGSGVFNMSGGSLTNLYSLNPTLTVGANGTFNLQSGGSLNEVVTVNPGGVFNIEGGAFITGGGAAVNGGTFQLLGNSATSGEFSGTSGYVQNGALLATVFTVSDLSLQQFNGTIRDGSTGSLGLNLTGSLQLGGVNTYTGNTTLLTGGLLVAGNNGVFSTTSNVVMGGGTLDASTFNSSIGGLSGTSGTVNIDSGGVLNVGANSSSFSYGANLAGTGTLTKVGTGTFTMTGGGSFNGAINIQQGILAAGAVNGIPTGASLTITGLGATFQINANQSLANYSCGVLSNTIFSNNSVLTIGSGNAPDSIGAVFTGTGTFIKVGSGTTTFGFGPGDSFANTDSALIVDANAGTLALAKNPGTDAIAGPLNIGGGTVLLTNSNQIDDASAVTINSGSLNLNSFNETIGGLSGPAAGNISLGGGTLTVAQSTSTTYSGSITGPGSFNKNGVGTLTLTGASTYSGTFVANAGLLVLQGAENATGFIANNGGDLQFNSSTVNLTGSSIIANPGGVVQYIGSNISNGFLVGGGTHLISGAATSTFTGVTTYNSTTITQNGPVNLVNFTNGGTLNNNAVLSFNGGVNGVSGIINVNNVFNAQNFSNQGVINIGATGNLVNSNSSLYLGGGSRMYIGTQANPGGTLTLQNGTTLEVNGALLVNDGKINGTTDVNFGGVAQGIGTYGPVNVTYGGLYQPGFTSSGQNIPTQGSTITSLTGNGVVDNQSAGGSLSLDVNSAAVSTFSGIIQNTTGTLGLTLSGAGGGLTLLTTTLPGGVQSSNSYTGGTTINSGTFTVGAAGALPAGGTVVNNGAFNVLANSTSGNISGNGALTVGQNSKLVIAPNTHTSTQGSVTINSGSTLDITNNTLKINFGAPANDPVASIVGYLASGYKGGAWTGNGINSSTSAAGNGNPALSVGYADGNTDGGTTAGANQVVVKYTLAGDSNLDGLVNFNDLVAVVQNFNKSGTDWAHGNFAYSATTNFNDLVAVVQNFNKTLNPAGSSDVSSGGNTIALSGSTSLTAGASAQIQSTSVQLPEPAAIGILVLGGAALARRKRKTMKSR